MTHKAKYGLIAAGVLTLIVASILFGQWRSARSTHEPVVELDAAMSAAAQSDTAPAPRPAEEEGEVQDESQIQASENNSDLAGHTVCAQVSGIVLAHYFTASNGTEDWREILDGMLSETGKAEQDTIDQQLIRPQEMLGFPAAKEAEDSNALRLHCEGTSTLTGWMVSLSRTGPTAPWLVDSIRAMETKAGYLSPRTLEEPINDTGDA